MSMNVSVRTLADILFRRGTFCALIAAAILAPGCRRSSDRGQTVVIAVPADVNTFSPIYASDVTSAEINELLFPMLVNSEFDTLSGSLTYTPGLASRWESMNGGRDIVFHLRTDVAWSDSVPIRAGDVRFTFRLYGDTAVGSVWQEYLEVLARDRNGGLDVDRAVEVTNDSTVIFHFDRPSPGHLYDVGLPILPMHRFAAIPTDDLRSHPINQAPVVAGPFALGSHVSMQEIVLQPNPLSRLPHPATLERLMFRVVPDYRTRILQLMSGEVDMVSALEWEDVRRIENENRDIEIVTTPPRRFNFVGWNNIDPDVWERSNHRTVRPHPLFGSAAARRALTMAIDRQDIASALLGPFAVPAFGPVSPMFRWAYNDTLRPLPFDPGAAMAILQAEGWKDADGDGILEKDGRKFAFTLIVPSGNLLWSEVATVVQQRLRDIKVQVTIKQTERSVFWPNVMSKSYDAWIVGFEVPLDVRLEDMWNSDLSTHPFNILSYRNAEVDALLGKIRNAPDQASAAADVRRVQALISNDQPCTFLFWERSRIGVNRRVIGVHSSIQAMTHDAWDWSVRGAH